VKERGAPSGRVVCSTSSWLPLFSRTLHFSRSEMYSQAPSLSSSKVQASCGETGKRIAERTEIFFVSRMQWDQTTVSPARSLVSLGSGEFEEMSRIPLRRRTEGRG